ncbi:hypothetical protein [Nodosilinea sp. P-1105]|uniref:hypothetical protein n=1 Tax=Nodosilinea sp. P-1105 TaxID=2546229 RepID=UPI00146D10AE|nr:hypothetical protein [Nodosilinea sp. P-1105]NMF85872.1 hypothetical protein [Nodosilinea sp. P-1105]
MPIIKLSSGVSTHAADRTPTPALDRRTALFRDEQGDRHLSEAEVERQQKELALQRQEQLEAFLRSQGFDPENLPDE